MTDQLAPFFTVDFNNGNRLTFDSMEEAEAWFAEERKFWNWFLKAPTENAGQRLGNLRSEFSQSLNTIGTRMRELKSDSANPQFLQALHNSIQGPVNNGKLLLRNHPMAVISSDVASRFSAAAGAAALGWLLKIPIEGASIIEGIIEAMLLRDGAEKRSPLLLETALNDVWVKNQPKIDKSLHEVSLKSNEASNLLAELKSALASVVAEKEQRWTEMSRRVNDAVNAAIESIEATESSYKSQMELQASVDYWTKKAEKHAVSTRSAQSALLWFSWLGSAALILILFVLSYVASEKANGDIAVYLKFAAVGAIAVTIGFWAARVLLRIFLSERHLATDAEERVTMVKTYLALANEKQIESVDRALVLAPLFRSAADGIVRDEGPDASLAGVIARAIDLKTK